MCFDFLNAYLQLWVLSLWWITENAVVLIFCGLMVFKQFSNYFFYSWVLYLFFTIAMSVMNSATHMERVFVEQILEVSIFLNNFELWQSIFVDTYLVADFLYSSWIFNVFCHHHSFKDNEGLFFTVLLQGLKQGKILNTW